MRGMGGILIEAFVELQRRFPELLALSLDLLEGCSLLLLDRRDLHDAIINERYLCRHLVLLPDEIMLLLAKDVHLALDLLRLLVNLLDVLLYGSYVSQV